MRALLPELVTYSLGIACGWWLAGRWGAGIAAGCFCAARIYAFSLPRGNGRE